MFYCDTAWLDWKNIEYTHLTSTWYEEISFIPLPFVYSHEFLLGYKQLPTDTYFSVIFFSFSNSFHITFYLFLQNGQIACISSSEHNDFSHPPLPPCPLSPYSFSAWLSLVQFLQWHLFNLLHNKSLILN